MRSYRSRQIIRYWCHRAAQWQTRSITTKTSNRVARLDRLIWAREAVASRRTAFSRAVPQLASKCATVSRQVVSKRNTSSPLALPSSSSNSTIESQHPDRPLSATQRLTVTQSACTLSSPRRLQPRRVLRFRAEPEIHPPLLTIITTTNRTLQVKSSLAEVESIRQIRRKIQMRQMLVERRAIVAVL